MTHKYYITILQGISVIHDITIYTDRTQPESAGTAAVTAVTCISCKLKTNHINRTTFSSQKPT